MFEPFIVWISWAWMGLIGVFFGLLFIAGSAAFLGDLLHARSETEKRVWATLNRVENRTRWHLLIQIPLAVIGFAWATGMTGDQDTPLHRLEYWGAGLLFAALAYSWTGVTLRHYTWKSRANRRRNT